MVKKERGSKRNVLHTHMVHRAICFAHISTALAHCIYLMGTAPNPMTVVAPRRPPYANEDKELKSGSFRGKNQV